MSRFSPQGRVQNQSGDIIGDAISRALSGIAGRNRQGDADRKADAQRSAEQAEQAKRQSVADARAAELHPLQVAMQQATARKQGILPASEAGATSVSSAQSMLGGGVGLGAAITGALQPSVPVASQEERYKPLAPGYVFDTMNANDAIKNALSRNSVDDDYKRALTAQALAVAGKQQQGASSRIDPLSEEGIKRQSILKRLEASLRPAPKSPSTDSPKPTEFSGKAALVTPKAEQSAQILEEFYTKGIPAKQGLGALPVVGNYMLSEDEQRAQQAAEAVSMAILRLESGASVSDEEMKNQAKQIIPKAGDGPAVREQKRATLRTIISRMKAAAEPTMSREAPDHVQTIDEMIRAGKSDAEIKAAMQRGVR